MGRSLLLLILLTAMLAGACSGAEDVGDLPTDIGDLSTDSATDLASDLASELDDVDAGEATEAVQDAAGDVAAAIDAQGCQDAAQAFEDIPGSVTDALTGATDVADVQIQADAFREVADQAPADVAADMQVLADAFDEVSMTLGDLDLGDGTSPSSEAQQALQELSTTLSGEELASASEDVSTWFTDGCPA